MALRPVAVALVLVGCRSEAVPEGGPAPRPEPASSVPAPSRDAEAEAVTPVVAEVVAGEPVHAEVEAEPEPEEPSPPSHWSCAGRWTGTVTYDRTRTCSIEKLEPFREIELVIRAGPSDWEADLVEPEAAADFEVEAIYADWEDAKQWCQVRVDLSRGPEGKRELFWVEVQRGELLRDGSSRTTVAARADLREGKHCMGYGAGHPAELVPGDPALPPVESSHAGKTGTLELAIAWPKIECPIVPKEAYAVEISVDRSHGDRLVVEGLDGKVSEARVTSGAELWIETLQPIADDPDGYLARLDLELTIEGEGVSGRAAFDTILDDINDRGAPCRKVEAEVRGSRRPPAQQGQRNTASMSQE